jgi:hypothetical protein
MKTLKHFALTITIFCLFQLTAQAQSLSGTWYSSDNAPVTLTQNGSSVTGSYRGGRNHESLTGTIEGTFDGRTLRCTYRNREGNVSGSGNCYFTLNGNQLVGRWEGGGRSGEWVLTRSGGASLGAREDNTALNGTRLTYYQRPDFNQCQADCANNANCKGFTWIQAGTYNANDAAMCYLMSAVTGRYSARGHFSGVKGDGGGTGGGGGGGATISAYKLEGSWQFNQQCKGPWGLLIGIKPTSDTTFEGGFENGNGTIKDGRISGNQITFTRVIYEPLNQVQSHWGTLVNEGGRLKIINGGWSGHGQETCNEAKTWRAEKR